MKKPPITIKLSRFTAPPKGRVPRSPDYLQGYWIRLFWSVMIWARTTVRNIATIQKPSVNHLLGWFLYLLAGTLSCGFYLIVINPILPFYLGFGIILVWITLFVFGRVVGLLDVRARVHSERFIFSDIVVNIWGRIPVVCDIPAIDGMKRMVMSGLGLLTAKPYQNIGMLWLRNLAAPLKISSLYITLTVFVMIIAPITWNSGSVRYDTGKGPQIFPAPIAYSHISLKKIQSLVQPDLKLLDTLETIWINKLRPYGTYPNDYASGNCTFYAASRLPVPNSMGNANNWAYAASLAGLTVSGVPKAGSVAQTSGDSWLGHVAVVESVNPDGSFVISEMNAQGYGVIDSRVATTAEFPNFIYP